MIYNNISVLTILSNPDPRIRFWKIGSGSNIYFVLEQNILFHGIFLPNVNILWHLNLKIKTILSKLYVPQFYITRKLQLYRPFMWIMDPGDPKWTDPDPQLCSISLHNVSADGSFVDDIVYMIKLWLSLFFPYGCLVAKSILYIYVGIDV